MKLLGTWITNDLKWDTNTKALTKRAYARMRLLHSAARYTKCKNDLKSIYQTYIRPILEQSATVWHSSLTEENKNDLKRVQKSAVRVIMGSDYKNYEESLKSLNMDNLDTRRVKLCQKMALKTCQTDKMKYMFPKRKEIRSEQRRYTNKYIINKAHTTRYQNSAIPYMQKIINEQDKKKKKIVPVPGVGSPAVPVNIKL